MRVIQSRLAMPILLAVPLALSACGGEPAKQADSSAPAASAPAAAPEPAAEETKPVNFAELKGDAAKGETVFAQCKSCHSLEPGKAMIGPSLHGVVGRAAASVPGFAYSAGMKKSGFTWDEPTLFHYLESPMKDVPGTKMAFAGIKDPQKRADVVAYLVTQK